jgi:pectin methylesterase-like acyl-CoA thioesterase
MNLAAIPIRSLSQKLDPVFLFRRPLCRHLPAWLILFLCLIVPSLTRGATVVWTGLPTGTSSNWSDPGAWAGGVAPDGTADVKFFDPGAVATISNINNFVDVSFAGYIGSLQYGNTNLNHTTLIAAGQTLNVTNTGGLTVGTLTDNGNAQQVNATVTGAGGTLNVSNTAAVIYVTQGRAANGNSSQRATLDLSGLDTFLVTANRIEVGTREPGGTATSQNATGTLKLARTNLLSLAYAPASYTLTVNETNALGVGENDGNNGGVNFLFLGQSNAFFLDGLTVGKTKTTSTMLFNPAFNSPVAYFRGTGGPASRVTFWSIGDMQSTGSSSGTASGTNDFSGGTVDALVNTMSLARDRSGNNTGTSTTRGTLTFTAGTIDVNTLLIGNQAFSSLNTNPMAGIFNVNGPNATLVVNNTLVLGNTTANSVAATNSSGTLTVKNGTVRANTISVGAVSQNNSINFSNATLILSNTIASPAKALTTFNLTNSTLQLYVGSTTNIVVTNLVAGGATNIIYPASVPVYASYPAEVVLVKYHGFTGGVGYNFGFGPNPLPPTAPGAYLSNNVANASIDLVLPNDPRPVITTEPASYSGNPGDNVTFTAVVSPYSVTPLGYQWYLGTTALTDGPTGHGSMLSGSLTASLSLTSAQPADNGSYTLVVTNVYGATTSTPPANLTISSGCVAPSISGPNDTTVIQGNNATFSASIAGSPLPGLQWQRGGVDISGATAASYTLTNAQYPADDQAVFSLVATNACGAATNSATLTVIVPPTISTQPTNVVVINGGPVSFSVTASGVPAPGYTWLKNGGPIPGNPSALTATLTIAAAAPSDIGTYSVQVTNTAGSLTSSNVSLIVNSATLAVSTLAPTNGAANISYDTPLYLTFNQAPVLRTAGQIRIYNATNPATPVDTLDLGQGSLQSRAVGGEAFNTYPVVVSGNQASIFPHAGVLTSNQTYYVTVDDGVFADSLGAYFAGISATNAWQFASKPGGPANPTNLVVAQDYSGDFATVQGALDSLPNNNSTPTLVTLQNGFYQEIVNFHFKSNILVRGQSRNGTIVGYANNSSLNNSTHFRMAVKVNADDIAFDNLTITNLTAQDLTQAEALMVESGAQRIIVNNCNVDSYQDTILANISTSKAYLNRSLIQGDVDFIWGGGNLFFTNCEVRWLIRSGNSGALGPNPSPNAGDIGSNGFSFVNCRLTTLPGANPADVIGRTRGITNGNTALINCFISTNIGGWSSDAVPTSSFRNWYFDCTNDLGASVTLSNGIALAPSDPNVTLAGSATSWLYGWTPSLSPNIISQPASQAVAGGQMAAFSVGATGIPDPTYQWLKNGTNLPGATDAMLTFPAAYAGDAGSYAVVVSNGAGSVTSATVTLTVGNTAPSLAPVSDQTVNVGVTINVTNQATDPDVPPQTLAFTLLSGPANATLNASSGVFTWRPLVSQANSSNFVEVVVADNGSPSLSATQSFRVFVNPLTQPDVSSVALVAGQLALTVSGQTGPDYAVQASTNFTDWQTVFTTNSPILPFQWTDPNSGAYPLRFYRIAVGPPLP